MGAMDNNRMETLVWSQHVRERGAWWRSEVVRTAEDGFAPVSRRQTSPSRVRSVRPPYTIRSSFAATAVCAHRASGHGKPSTAGHGTHVSMTAPSSRSSRVNSTTSFSALFVSAAGTTVRSLALRA